MAQPVRSGFQRRTRRAALGALGTAAAAAFAACGAPGASQAPPSAAPAPAKLVWEHPDTPTFPELAKQTVALLRQKAPHIEVEPAVKAKNWQEKDLASMAAGSGPDVLQAWDQFSWQFASKGALLNLNDLVRDLKKPDLDDYAKGQWSGFQIPGTSFRYGLPQSIGMGVVYYNRDAFRRAGVPEPSAGWTYAEYADRAKKLTRVDGDKPTWGVHHPTNNYVRIQNHLWAFGGHMVDPKDATKLAAHQPAAQQAMDWLYDRYWSDNTFIQPKQQGSFKYPDLLGNGMVAMVENGITALQSFARLNGVEWDLAPIPKGPAAKMSWITTEGWVIWKQTPAKAAAWELVKFLNAPDYLKLQARSELLVPPRLSLLDDWMQVARQKYPVLEKVNLKLVREQLEASPAAVATLEQFPCYGEAIVPIQDILDKVFDAGTARPSLFRDRKDEIERAATACGASFK